MKTNPKLSIVIPVYNEKDTIDEIARRVQNAEYMNYQYPIVEGITLKARKQDGKMAL